MLLFSSHRVLTPCSHTLFSSKNQHRLTPSPRLTHPRSELLTLLVVFFVACQTQLIRLVCNTIELLWLVGSVLHCKLLHHSTKQDQHHHPTNIHAPQPRFVSTQLSSNISTTCPAEHFDLYSCPFSNTHSLFLHTVDESVVRGGVERVSKVWLIKIMVKL